MRVEPRSRLANPQHLNPYSYVRNNPLTYSEPSGHCIPGIGDCQYTGSRNWSDEGAYLSGAAEAAASAVVGVVTAPIAVAQTLADPGAPVQGLQDQAATVVRGAQFLANDPAGAADAEGEAGAAELHGRRQGIHRYRLPPDSPARNLIERYRGVVNDTAMPGPDYPTIPSLLAAIGQALTRCRQCLPNQPQSLKSH